MFVRSGTSGLHAPLLETDFYTCTKVQYAGREWRRILEYYRARVNTIPSGNKPAACYEWQRMPGPFDQNPVPVTGFLMSAVIQIKTRWEYRAVGEVRLVYV